LAQLLDRNRLYALIGSLEDDLRELIRTYLLEDLDEQEVLGAAYEKAAERFLEDPDALTVDGDILDYLDLGDELGILQRYRQVLPDSIQQALASSARRLEELVGIRNRVMHRRPLLPDDYDNASRWLFELSRGGFTGDSLQATLKQLREDPTWSPTAAYETSSVSVAVNNLPLPDFDETGLIGRRRQVEVVKRLLAQRRFPVLTLIGPGGIGKTALALQALYEVAEDVDSPYDLIAWVSLKTEQLTAAGVQSLRDAVRSIEGAIPSLAAPLDESFAGSASELAQSLEGINAILAVDNLETVSASEVIALVDELPATVTCLFTSRVGLGQLERREAVGPLDVPAAIDLFRRLCRAHQIDHLAKLSQKRIEEVLSILSTSPLAIKWFVLAAAAGQAPETILRQQTDLIRFCVQNVYQGLPEPAKDAAVVLAHVNRPLSIQDLKLYFSETSPDGLRSIMQELLRRSLCNISIADDALTERFQATDALVEYLKIVGGASDDFLRRVQRTEDEYRREEERLLREQGRTPLRVNVVSGSLEHRASALRLRDALKASAKGDVTIALQIIDEIEQFEPDYWELFRVRGFILSQSGRIEEATEAYERALALAPDSEAKARVRFFYAGHLIRRARDAEGALEQAREAHKILQRHETALELGRALTYVGDFPTAIELLRYACETTDVRGQLIAGTQLVSTLRRQAAFEAEDLRSPVSALDTLQKALHEGIQMLSNGVHDQKLEEELYECIAEALKYASWMPEGAERDAPLRPIVSIAQSIPLGGIGRARRYLSGNAARLLAKPGLPGEVISVLRELADLDLKDEDSEHLQSSVRMGAELIGTIRTWKPDGRFGFISAIDRSGEYYFHAVDLEDPIEQLFIERGLAVRFTAATSKGRPRAIGVSLRDAPDMTLLQARTLTVLTVSRGFLLARDDKSGTNVFVGRHALRNGRIWNSITEGTELIANVEAKHRDRFAAVPGSVVVD
jgi:tetratricopeptide (TPR) repeat protein/cold shock CspA family protein